MDNEGSVVPVIFANPVEFHLDDEGEVVIRTRMESFLYLSSLHEEVTRKIFIICFSGCSKSLGQDRLSLRVVVKQVEEPSAVKFQHSISIADGVSHIGVSVLKIAGDIF